MASSVASSAAPPSTLLPSNLTSEAASVDDIALWHEQPSTLSADQIAAQHVQASTFVADQITLLNGSSSIPDVEQVTCASMVSPAMHASEIPTKSISETQEAM
ncbi:hypothetical protein ACP70R_025341 [Stipagrostis hirtigluma subsp. patula]